MTNLLSRLIAQVNVLDNGRTFKNPYVQNNRSVVGQLTHNGTTNFLGNNITKPLVQFPVDASNQIYNHTIAPVFRLPQQNLRTNSLGMGGVARFSGANGSLHQTLGSGLQTALTIGTGGLAKGIEAGASRLVPGATPTAIRLLAPRVASNAVLGGGYGLTSGIANGDNARQVLGRDLGLGIALGGALPIAGKAVQVGGKLGAKAAVNTGRLSRDIATAKPFRHISDPELAAVQRVAQARNGFGDAVANVQPNDVAIYRSVQRKLGTTNPNDHRTIDVLLGARRTYNTHMALQAQRLQAVKDFTQAHPVGLGMRPVDGQGNFLTLERSNKAALKGVDKAITDTNKTMAELDNKPISTIPASRPENELQTQFEAAFNKNDMKAAQAIVNQVSNKDLKQPLQDLIDRRTKTPVVATKPQSESPKVVTPLQPKLQGINSAKPGGGSLAKNTPLVAENSLTSGAKAGRQNISPETQAQLSGEHNVRNTQKLADYSEKVVNKLPINTSIEQSHNMLAAPLGNVNDEQTAFIAKTIEKVDTAATKARAAGKTAEADRLTREAAALHDGLSEHATARGQANQALIMMYNQSPQGLLYRALRDLKRAGIEDTPELRAKLQPMVDAIKTAKNPAAKTDALATFHKNVSQLMPQNISDKLIGIWKAGLLSGVKTQQGNAISNATIALLKKVSDVPATAADSIMSLGTHERTKSLTFRGSVSGTKTGFKNAKFTMKTGIDRRLGGDKYEQHAEIDFSNPVLKNLIAKPANLIFRGMNAADQPFWYSSFKNSMYDQAKADGLTKGLTGKALRDHMDNLVANPTDKIANAALREANKSTLNFDTLGSKAVQGIHKGIDNFPGASKQGKAIAHGIVNVLAPFVRVPTAFLSRTVDFTPFGVGKEIFHQVAAKQFDQRMLSQAIGEGLTGTGAIALGIHLTHNNMLSGDYPKNDQKEQQRWKAEGITPNSVKLGGKWISLNYIGPLGLLFNMGNKLVNSQDPAVLSRVGGSIAGLGQGLMGQSFLQGFSGFSDAVNDPQRNLGKFVNSQGSSIVPSIINDVANATDKYQRQADNVGQAIKNRIPGLRETNPIKQDVYGNPLKQAGGQLGTVNGFKPSNSLTGNSPAITEVNRLHSVDPSNPDLQITPTPIKKKLTDTANGINVTLNNKQVYDLQKAVGQSTQNYWNRAIKSPQYQKLSDIEKANALTKIRQDATTLAERRYIVDNNLGSYNKQVTAKQARLAQGDVEQYLQSGTKTTTPRVATIKTAKAKSTKVKSSGGRTRTAKSYVKLRKPPTVPKISLGKLPKAPRAKRSKFAFKVPSTPKQRKVHIA